MNILKDTALLLFGWIPIGEKFVKDGAEYIAICLREGGQQPTRLPDVALIALSQLAYTRAATRDRHGVPRWRNFVREMEDVSELVAQGLAGNEICDQRIRSILNLHRVL